MTQVTRRELLQAKAEPAGRRQRERPFRPLNMEARVVQMPMTPAPNARQRDISRFCFETQDAFDVFAVVSS